MFFLWIILFFILIFFIFIFSSIKLEFENVTLDLPKIEDEKEGTIKLNIYLFKKIKIFTKNLNKINIQKSRYNKVKNLLVKFKNNKKHSNLNTINIIKKLNINFEKINLKIKIGIEDAALNAVVVGILYTITENIVNRNTNDFQECYISPVYNKNILSIQFDGIFTLNMRNIISIIVRGGG